MFIRDATSGDVRDVSSDVSSDASSDVRGDGSLVNVAGESRSDARVSVAWNAYGTKLAFSCGNRVWILDAVTEVVEHQFEVKEPQGFSPSVRQVTWNT